jgi:hypothetical protein
MAMVAAPHTVQVMRAPVQPAEPAIRPKEPVSSQVEAGSSPPPTSQDKPSRPARPASPPGWDDDREDDPAGCTAGGARAISVQLATVIRGQQGSLADVRFRR